MLISKKMAAAINEQVGREFGAELQYVAIASYFAREGLNSLAQKFYSQAAEERDHAMRFVQFLNDTDSELNIPAVAAPRPTFKSAADAVELSLNQEKAVTRQINELVELALKESDHLTHNFLQWFIKEQLEEIASMDTLLRIVQRAGEERLLLVEEFLVRSKGNMSGAPKEFSD
jgi:bacterioferritin B